MGAYVPTSTDGQAVTIHSFERVAVMARDSAESVRVLRGDALLAQRFEDLAELALNLAAAVRSTADGRAGSNDEL